MVVGFFFNSSPAICVGGGEDLDIANPIGAIGGENQHPAPLVLPENFPIIDAPVTPENGAPDLFVTPEDPSPRPRLYSWGFQPIPPRD